jgi:hypothetical protein
VDGIGREVGRATRKRDPHEIRCVAPGLSEYSRALRSAARMQAVADAEGEVGVAWAAELLRLRDSTREGMAAGQALLDVIEDELGQLADAAGRRDEMARAGRLRVAAARRAVYRA